MATVFYEELEKVYPKMVRMMPEDEFNFHAFILKLAQKYQKLYVQALYVPRDQKRPFNRVHIAKRLKQRMDLVKQIRSEPSNNIFGETSKVAVWRRVK